MEGPRSEWLTRRPAPALAPFVDRYVGYRLGGLSGGLHRAFPSRHLTFIVSIGPEIDVVAQTNPTQAPSTYRVVIGGLQVRAHRAHGYQEGVAFELTPLGCRALLGLPARELWNIFELDELDGPDRVELWSVSSSLRPGPSALRSATRCSPGLRPTSRSSPRSSAPGSW